MVKTLREQRTERLLSLRDLASRSGTTAKTLVDLEHGRRLATFKTMTAVSAALGVAPHEIREFADAIAVRAGRTQPQGPMKSAKDDKS
jgi:transcriptional regulator with XRE-family HTH domain